MDRQDAPAIILTPARDASGSGLDEWISLSVQNVGSGAALDVRVELVSDLNEYVPAGLIETIAAVKANDVWSTAIRWRRREGEPPTPVAGQVRLSAAYTNVRHDRSYTTDEHNRITPADVTPS
jgi:hypothetical protein